MRDAGSIAVPMTPRSTEAASRGAGLTGPTRKGTAFTHDERRRLGLDGLLPPRVETLAEQAARVLDNVRRMDSPLDRYRYLSAVQTENETVFYRVVLDNLEEMLPIIYTPTVGEACLQWSRIFERPRGMYLSAFQHRGRVAQVLRNWPRPHVSMIVVTDGGRILGLGDLGANGMGIPIGKLSLYTVCGGIPPWHCLPVTLDVGTDNDSVRADACYLGERHPRLTGADYDTFLDEFVSASQTVFPGAVVQFEDFNNRCAFHLLDRYRDRVCCFNDDIQGTGAMGLAGLEAAGRITGRRLVDERILFVGAGEACLGIGALVAAAMQQQGLSHAEARARCLFLDSKGAVSTRRADLADSKRPFAQDRAPTLTLTSAVDEFAPTVLIGACAQPGIFDEAILRKMARLNEQPIVLALSNPTAKAECTAAQAYRWSDGRAIFASGSPFDPVEYAGRRVVTAQGNNCFIFPGVGLGLLLSGAHRVTDDMFVAAARALTAQVSIDDLRAGRIFPPASRIRDVAISVAAAVAETAYGQRLATLERPADLTAAARRAMYWPAYD